MREAKLGLCVFLVMLTSCSTSYGKKGVAGGYTDRQIDSNTFIVHYAANQYTAPDLLEAYTVYRCAEITLQQGCDYFMLLDPSYAKRSVRVTVKVYRGDPPSDEPRAYDARDVKEHLDGLVR